MHSRKQKFMHHQLSKSNAGTTATSATVGNILGQTTGAGSSLQNAKHKVNLSADINMVSNNMGTTPLSNQNQNKQSVGYDRIKGLTPVSGKNGQALKNNFHLHNQMHDGSQNDG